MKHKIARAFGMLTTVAYSLGVIFLITGVLLSTVVTPAKADTNPIWDKSSLVYLSGTCSGNCSGPISETIQNHGSDMQGTVTYYVFLNGGSTPVATGTVPALKSGESYTITFTPTQSGTYSFEVDQRPGHPGTGRLGAGSCTVICTVPPTTVPPTEVPPTTVPPTSVPPTLTNTPTNTPTATATNTPTSTPTSTPTNTPTNTPTATPTNTPTNTPTSTPSNTPVPGASLTPTPLPSETPTPTNTPVPTEVPPTATNTPLPTATNTPVPTSVPPTSVPPTATPTNRPNNPSSPTSTPVPNVGSTTVATLPPPATAVGSATQMLLPITGPDASAPVQRSDAESTLFFNLGIGLLGLGLVFHGTYFRLGRGK